MLHLEASISIDVETLDQSTQAWERGQVELARNIFWGDRNLFNSINSQLDSAQPISLFLLKT